MWSAYRELKAEQTHKDFIRNIGLEGLHEINLYRSIGFSVCNFPASPTT